MDGLFSSHRRPNFGKRPVTPTPAPQTAPQTTQQSAPSPMPAQTPAPTASPERGQMNVLSSSIFMKKKDEAANSHDIACAVALGLVEAKHMSVTLEAVAMQDSSSRSIKIRKDWLNPNDPLGALTKELFDTAAATAPPTTMSFIGIRSKPAKTLEEAQARVDEIKMAAMKLLRERGVFDQAKFLGLKLLVDENYQEFRK